MVSLMKSFIDKQLFIPIILFICAYAVLSFNLSEQGPHSDELDFFYAFSNVYFNLFKNGDFFNPCWNGNGECTLISVKECNMQDHWVGMHGVVKHLMVGLGAVIHGVDYSKSYAPEPPLCKPHNDPLPGINVPTKSELTAARFFSPILGSLTVVIAFVIGKILFNRIVGISFGLLLLFNSLWFAYNRTIMTEAYIYFFMMLSFLLLLYSVREKEKIGYPLLVLSAIIFGVAFDTKAIVFMFLPLFLGIIFLRGLFNEKLNKKSFQTPKYLSKSIILAATYVGIFFVAIIVTLPFYWIGPFEQIMFQRESLDAYTTGMSLNMPWEANKIHVRFMSTITVTIAPIIDVYYYFNTNDIPESLKFANNFSSVPLTILFVIGLIYTISSLRSKRITGSELLIIFWFISIFVLMSTMNKSYSPSRFYVMMFLPIFLIAAYGYHRFFSILKNKYLGIFSLGLTISAHAITTLIFWDKIFFQPSIIWSDPLMIKSQVAISHPEVLILSAIFIIFFGIFGIKKIKIKTRA